VVSDHCRTGQDTCRFDVTSRQVDFVGPARNLTSSVDSGPIGDVRKNDAIMSRGE